jgi:hypothetical protein
MTHAFVGSEFIPDVAPVVQVRHPTISSELRLFE